MSGQRVRAIPGRQRGLVIDWRGQFGWIEPDVFIDHVEAAKHQGRVYVNRKDVKGKIELYNGARVSFYLYADGDGIGAEEVKVDKTEDEYPSSNSGNWPGRVPGAAPDMFGQVQQQQQRVPGAPPELLAKAKQHRVPGAPAGMTSSPKGSAEDATEKVRAKAAQPRGVAAQVASLTSNGHVSSSSTAAPAPPSRTAPHEASASAFVPPPPPVRAPPHGRTNGMAATTSNMTGPGGIAMAIRGGSPPWSRSDDVFHPQANSTDSGFGPWNVWESHEGTQQYLSHDHAYQQWSQVQASDVAGGWDHWSQMKQGNGTVPTNIKSLWSAPPPPPAKNGALPAAVGTSGSAASSCQAADPPDKWWRDLDDSCPISLESIGDLTCEPFGLLGSTSDGIPSPSEGVWGPNALAAVKEGRLGAIHWFDGMFLASFLVSSSQFIDVVSRRPLTRGECVSLDEYLAYHRLPAVHVADAFDLSQAFAGRGSSSGADSDSQQERIAAFERKAAAMLRSLFDFRSSSRNLPPPPPRSGQANSASSSANGRPPPPPQRRIGPKTGLGGSAGMGNDEDPADWPLPSGHPAGGYMQRTVHNEGGLRVIDDGGCDDWSEEHGEGHQGDTSDPTPAEALALNRVPASASRAKASRVPKAQRAGAHAKSGQKSPGDVAQVSISFSSGGRGRGTASSNRGRGTVASSSSDSVADEIPVCDVWTPEWASPELHDRLLQEVLLLEAELGENFEVLNPDCRRHFEDCAHHRRINASPTPLQLEVLHRIEGDRDIISCVVRFSLPVYYPMHAASVSLQPASDVAVAYAEALERLQQVLRDEVLDPIEGSESVLPVVRWLQMHGAAEFARAQAAQEAETSASCPASGGEQVPSKRERVEQAKKERLSSKFSDKWDLCYAFVKHGCCKDKNCQWSHDVNRGA